MADISAHAPGAFSWPELSTTDQRGGAAFYRALFDWEADEQPIGPTDTYTMFKMRGREVAAATTLQADQRKMGVPPHWNNYVTVKSADETAARAKALGGNVLAPAFDVMDVGRMAVLQDPTGAVFMIWEPRKQIGARILNEPGALCWTELTTSDPPAAEKFYTALFGWTAKHSAPGAVMQYTEFSVGDTPGIGMMAKPKEMPAHIPSYWMPYFQIANLDASVGKAKGMGGRLVVGPNDISNMGRFAIMTDPQGAIFAIYQHGA